MINFSARVLLIALLTLAGQPWQAACAYQTQQLVYGKDENQRIDLHLPDDARATGPLLVVVNGALWNANPERDRLAEDLVAFWTSAGLRVAQVWYRPAPQAVFPAQAQDVATALVSLREWLDQQPGGSTIMCLLGHASGAHLAALLMLDSRYLEAAGRGTDIVSGVITLSGMYDLAPDYPLYEKQRESYSALFGDDRGRKAASPLHLERSATPPFLILVAEDDVSGYAVDARRLAGHLRALGNRDAIQLLVRDADHDSIMKLNDRRNPAAHLVLDFLRVSDLPENFIDLVRLEARWQKPPFSTEPFYDLGIEVNAYPVSDRMRKMIRRAFLGQEYRIVQWPLQTARAVDLFELLDALGEQRTGSGDFLQLTNVRGEKLFWKLDDLRPFKPVVVIGVDDERNLFRLSSFYKAKREYSWQEPQNPLPVLARSLGAFVYFREPPPAHLQPSYQAQFSLTPDSFRLLQSDPLAVFSDLEPALYKLVTVDNGCTSCHEFRGVGAKAHHVNAETGEATGGYALPLESYQPQVWKDFVFEQRRVAALIGASPNMLPEVLGRQLYELVEQERQAP